MTKSLPVRRILAALLISIALNGLLLVLGPLTEHHPVSVIARVLDLLGRPAAAFTEWLVPAGHDASHILGAIVVSILSSTIFYAVVAWIILKILTRAHQEGSDQSGSLSTPK
jgi:hypothetical protein